MKIWSKLRSVVGYLLRQPGRAPVKTLLIHHADVINGLSQFASEAEQRGLWLSAGGEVSSFVEAYC